MFNYLILFILLLLAFIIFLKWKCGRSFDGGRVRPASQELESQDSPQVHPSQTQLVDSSPEVFRKIPAHQGGFHKVTRRRSEGGDTDESSDTGESTSTDGSTSTDESVDEETNNETGLSIQNISINKEVTKIIL